jgi:hypothetical protein
MSVNDDELNEVADEDEARTDPQGNVLGEPSPEMVPGENLKMSPPRPAFGGGKLLDLKTGELRQSPSLLHHPSLGDVVDASEYITESSPPDVVHGTPTSASDLPPFQLPGDEDDHAGSVPAHHTVERPATAAAFLVEYERVDRAKNYLEDARAIATDIAKTVKSVVDALAAEGFSREEALALAQMVVEKKFQPFL